MLEAVIGNLAYDSILDAEIVLPGRFTCIRLDRTVDKIGYGGIAVYVREGLLFRIRQDIDSEDNECLCIELNRTNCRPAIICCAYRAPDADFDQFIANLSNGMSNVNMDKCDLVLLGYLHTKCAPEFQRQQERKTRAHTLLAHSGFITTNKRTNSGD